MATSTFFNNFGNSTEIELLEDLVVESIKIYGCDMYYIPRRLGKFDEIYYEDTISRFDTAYPIEIYVKASDGFGSQNTFMSKFGLEIRDQAVFSIARRTFMNEISKEEQALIRPRESDLIYFPLNKKCFEIKFVDNKPYFYQLGDLQMYDLTVELYEYSNEVFTTGIPEIDAIQNQLTINAYDYGFVSDNEELMISSDNYILVENEYEATLKENDPLRNNEDVDAEIDDQNIIDWTETNPFAEGRY